MSDARLATSVLVGALIRKTEGLGGFAAVLAKGDASAGALLLILTERGGKPRILERVLQPDGRYSWSRVTGLVEDVPQFVARRQRFDPDLWVLELDIPSTERFAAEMTAFD
ncbi:MAG TPA: DUF1491 family protein [Allosphingosinicella sp.]|jgi:hypothetical protein